MKTRVSHGITLIEVLLVIAIIGLLVSLMTPAIQASREAARRTACVDNQRQLGVGFTNFESSKKAFPASATLRLVGPLETDAGLEMYNFMAELLPFIEEDVVRARYHFDAIWYAPENAGAIGTVLSVAICPSTPRTESTAITKVVPSLLVSESTRLSLKDLYDQLDKKYTASFKGGVSDFAVVTGSSKKLTASAGYKTERLDSMFPAPIGGPGALFAFASKTAPIMKAPGKVEFSVRTRAAQVKDGLSKTFILTEVAGRPHHYRFGQRSPAGEPLESAWSDPYIAIDISGENVGGKRGCVMQCDNDDEIYSFHPNGVNFLFADGHVKMLAEDTDPKVLLALMTPDEGEVTEGN